jgi:cation diffusion facilitator CzcD-associated flavoprotein CzcO
VSSVAVIGGGSLAKDLTLAFSRLTGAGVEAIIRTPPFPVMQRAYQNKPVTEEEVVALTGFLRRMGEQQALHHPPGAGPRLAAAGVTGGALLLVLYALAWSKRSKDSVYQRIYDRQIKST